MGFVWPDFICSGLTSTRKITIYTQTYAGTDAPQYNHIFSTSVRSFALKTKAEEKNGFSGSFENCNLNAFQNEEFTLINKG